MRGSDNMKRRPNPAAYGRRNKLKSRERPTQDSMPSRSSSGEQPSEQKGERGVSYRGVGSQGKGRGLEMRSSGQGKKKGHEKQEAVKSGLQRAISQGASAREALKSESMKPKRPPLEAYRKKLVSRNMRRGNPRFRVK